MIDGIFITLALLFIKHWYVDFVNQTPEEVAHKGKYGNWLGVKHSLKHGVATVLVFFVADPFISGLLFIGLVDAVVHYHIDWAKMNYGNRDITTPQFWNHLGLDQLAHYITYLFLVWITL